MERLVSDEVIQDRRRRFCQIQRVRDGDQLFFIKIDVLGITSIDSQSGNRVAHGGIRDTLAKRIHDANDCITWHKRYLGRS